MKRGACDSHESDRAMLAPADLSRLHASEVTAFRDIIPVGYCLEGLP
jgi:hypothetical protein